MTKARDIASATTPNANAALLATNSALLATFPHKNLIINGAMQVAQRGTSFTGLGNGDTGYTVDRFRFVESGSPTYEFTVSQSTTVPSGSGFSYSIKYDCTTADTAMAAGDTLKLEQWIEAQNLQQLAYGSSSAKSLTLSFWVRSNKTGNYVVWFYQDDDARQISKTYSISSADTWEFKTLTIPGDTTGIFDNNNGRGLLLSWGLASGTTYTSGTQPTAWENAVSANRFAGLNVNLADSTSNEWYITGVQLELGDTSTPFEHRSYGDELARCQRYCYVITGGSDWHTYAGHVQTSTAFLWSATFPVPMRARASATFDNTNTQYIQGNNSNYGPTAFAVSAISQETMYVNTTSSGMSQGHGAAILLNSANKQIMDAEL